MVAFRPSMVLLAALLIGTGGPSMFADAQNVLGIDLGSEWIKLAVVQRSAGVQIVFNEASKRKSPNAVAFEPEQRQFGDTAMVKAHKAITHTRELLGKGFKAEILKEYGPYYFPYEIVEDEERGAIKIKEGDRFLSPEVLVAMILTYAKSLAQAQTKEKVADCVITVPSYFRQFERQALLDAASIAGLNVLSIMNDHTAVALKYGIDHNVASLTEPQNVLFYDMGSTATKASVVQFSSIPDKEAFQKDKTLGQLKVMSVAWDATLGGQAFSSQVADIMKGKSKQDPSKNPRAMAKLLQSAEKTKTVLSANKNAHPSIEGFIGDYDYRATVDRIDFEKESKELLARVDAPIKAALIQANLTAADIHKVEVIGGGWRIPKVQETLLEVLNRKSLDKTMNSDEAFCFGAALYAASLSTAFRLRKFGVHDITSFPVSIDIDSLGASEVSEEEGDDKEEGAGDAKEAAASSSKKNIKLFKVGHKIPAKRLLTFKRDEDLTFTVQYDGEVPKGQPSLIAKYNITGVKAAMDKYPKGGKPKINVSFRLTRSGLVDVDKAEAAIEEMVEVERCETIKVPKNKTNSTEGGEEGEAAASEGDDKKEDKEEEGGDEDKKEDKEEEGGGDEDKKEKKEEEGGDEDKKEKKEEEGGDEDKKGDKKKDDKKKKSKKEKKDDFVEEKVCKMKEEKRIHRVTLTVSADTPVLKPFNSTQIKESKAVLKEYDEREQKIRDRASAFNALESYVYNTREKLESNEEMHNVTSKEGREEFTEQLNKMGAWLDEDGWEASTEVLNEKLGELKATGDPIFFRMREALERPVAIQKAEDYLKLTLDTLANLTKQNKWLNESHTQIVTNKTDEIAEWIANKTAAQDALPGHEAPAFTAQEVYRKLDPLQALYKQVARIPKPAAPKKEKEAKDAKKDNATNATDAEGEGAAEGEGDGGLPDHPEEGLPDAEAKEGSEEGGDDKGKEEL